MTWVRRRPAEAEGGFAIVMALLITVIVFVVMTGILAQAIHNVVLSGYGRRRLSAINAAEAGLNWYANQLGTSGVVAVGNAGLGWTVPSASCDAAGTAITATCWYVFSPTNATAASQTTVATVPEKATFEIRVLYSSQNPCKDPSGALNTGAARQCGLANVPVRPSAWTTTNGVTALSQTGILQLVDTAAKPFPDSAYAIVRSTGIVGSVKRTLESYVRIRAIRGNLQGGLASISMCMGQSAKVNVYGDLSVNNEAVGGARPYAFSTNCSETYLTGDLVIGGQGGSLTLLASGDAGGSLTIRGGGVSVKGNAPFSVARDVWAEGSVVIGTGTSALSSCPLAGTIQCVGGDAIGSAVTVGSNAWVAGDTIICNPACPPAAAFPELPWRASDWKAPWVIQDNITTTTGLLATISSTSTPTVFHITATNAGGTTSLAPCDLEFDAKTVTINTNIAVVSECRFVFWKNPSTIQGSGALLLISASPEAGATTANCGTPASNYLQRPYGPRDITIENNPSFLSPIFIYTPCIMWIGNNQSQGNEDRVKGQFAARFMIINNAVTLTQNDIANFVTSLPGQIARFYQDVKFVREIPWKTANLNLSL